MVAFRKGTKVEWAWGKGHAEGVVAEVFKESVTKTIKGKKITRHGSEEKPAYLVKQENGATALKLHSELHKQEKAHGWV